jgi:hypothetical protein
MTVADRSDTDHPAERADLPYIALMHPMVGLALADWLDTEAATWAGDEVHNSCSTQSCTFDAALAVARQLLGTTEAEGAAVESEPDTELRDRIAAVLWPLTDWDGDELNAVAAADAVMPVVTDRLRRNWGEMRDRVAELETETQRLVDAAPPAPADRAAVLREVAEEFRATFGEVIVCGADGDWANVADWTGTGARIPACGSFYPHHTDTRCVLHKGHRGSHRAPWGRRTMAWPYDRRETPPAAPAAPEEPTR